MTCRAVGLLLLSCAHAPPAPATRLHALIDQVRADITRVRGAAPLRPVGLELLDDSTFEARRAAGRDDNSTRAKDVQHHLRVLADYHDVVEQTDGGTAPGAVTAAYDARRGVIIVRASAASDGASDHELVVILAHELGHALQHQRGLLGSPDSLEGALVHRALAEGDAQLTTTLVLAHRAGTAPRVAVDEARARFKSAFEAAHAPEWGHSPAVRVFSAAPYHEGARFLLDLYRAGGLELVDATLARPPRTTSEVSDAQAWLDGGPPRLTASPQLDRRLGSVFFRAFAADCSARLTNSEKYFTALASAYFDDAYRLEGKTLTWWVALNPAADAQALTRALRGLAQCLGHAWDDARATTSGDGLYVLTVGDPPPLPAPALASRAAPPFGRRTVPARGPGPGP